MTLRIAFVTAALALAPPAEALTVTNGGAATRRVEVRRAGGETRAVALAPGERLVVDCAQGCAIAIDGGPPQTFQADASVLIADDGRLSRR